MEEQVRSASQPAAGAQSENGFTQMTHLKLETLRASVRGRRLECNPPVIDSS